MEARITLCPATADISIGDYFRFHRALLPSCSKDEISRLDWTLPQTASAGMFFFADCSSVQGHMWLLFLVPFKYRLPLWMSLWLTEWVFLIQGLTQIGKSFFKNLIKMFHRQCVCVCVHQCNNTEAHYLLFAACFRTDWSAAAFWCLTGPPALSSKDESGQDLCALALAGVSLFSI